MKKNVENLTHSQFTKAELKKLGDRIKQLRIQKGYTSYEYFAYEKNISRAQYGRYEKGEDLRYSSLVKVVKAFDMSMEEFFSEGFK
ncbi:MAG: helix-turn-helix transcriptional regulator [Bacteroidia bacterium]|jgi:transcriptional regulator with XRE-family HTH domain